MEQAKSFRGGVAPRLLLIAVLTLTLSFGVLAASSLAPNGADQAHAASISKKSVTVTKGKTYKLKLKKATAKKVKWSSSKKSVATVSKSGTVKAKKAGKATITAKYKGKKYKCKVTVKNPPAAKKPSAVKSQTNLEKVMSAIDGSRYSVKTPDGSKAIVYSQNTDEGNSGTATIAADHSKKCVKFAFVVGSGSGDVNVTITLFVYDNPTAPAKVVIESPSLNYNCTGNANVDKATYTSTSKLSWKVVENGKDIQLESFNKNADSFVSSSMEVWDTLLKAYTGYEMSYLGFKKM